MRGEGFIRADYEMRYLVAERVEDVIPMILKAASRVKKDTREAAVIERF